jgi:hypothetical protein
MLGAEFADLASSYRPDPAGRLLVQWFREDWGMFELPQMDDAHAKELLADVLDDGEIVRQLFSPATDLVTDHLTQWESLREELMHHNRYFPNVNIDLSRLERLLWNLTLTADEVPRTWYRARIQTSEVPFPVAQMGAPPNRIASHGRANPAGIPYLYLGSTPETAISEIRPHTGELACVADFQTPDTIKVVDLRNPKKTVSPLLLAAAADISQMRSDLPFLARLGDELTRPVLPQSAAIDYTPSQYLCEFIKKCGYHGVIYRSSVSTGINMALFDPAQAQAGTVAQYPIVRERLHVEKLRLVKYLVLAQERFGRRESLAEANADQQRHLQEMLYRAVK